MYDIAIIGGGINGTGIALEAASRGLKVFLCEQHDLASGTSSKSSKMIHGGLRYLEHAAFGLVQESLIERERLLNNAGHLIHPIPFIIPFEPNIRSYWKIRLGLFAYDLLNLKSSLPRSKAFDFSSSDEGNPLQPTFLKGFRYYDCIGDDSRLVIALARKAASFGAHIAPQTRCDQITPQENLWRLTLTPKHPSTPNTILAKVCINATGPWIDQTVNQVIRQPSQYQLCKVKGSHIVVPRLYPQREAYLLPCSDGRVVFTLPYLQQYTLIGTTDLVEKTDPSQATITPEEILYLCQIVTLYFKHVLKPRQIVASWSGMRALIHYGNQSATEITREAKIEDLLHTKEHPPLINLYGGKITTYRSLSETVVDKLKSLFPNLKPSLTRNLPLPGHLPQKDLASFEAALKKSHAWIEPQTLKRMISCYGAEIYDVLQGYNSIEQLGESFGHGLYAQEVGYLMHHEWAMEAEDILWRRTKLGIVFNEEETEALQKWMEKNVFKRAENDS